MNPELRHIDISELDAHPQNPRLTLRQDVINSIASQIDTYGFSEAHALLVRPLEGRYQIVAGHHRWRAAQKAGASHVPCWVADLSDDETFMQLVLSNLQGELTPLEIGIHVLKAVPLAKGGRGQVGGLSEYAAKTGWSQPYLTQLRGAAQVYEYTHCSSDEIASKARHLYEISRSSTELWSALAEQMLTRGWSVAETTRQTDALAEFADLVPRNAWIPLDSAIDAYFASPQRLSIARLNGLLTAVTRVREWIESTEEVTDQDSEEFETWLEINSGGDSWDKRAIDGRLREMVERVRSRRRTTAQEAGRKQESQEEFFATGGVVEGADLPTENEPGFIQPADYVWTGQARDLESSSGLEEVPSLVATGWHLGRWQDHLDKLEDGEVAVLLTDPPYGMNYRSNMRKEKHEFIEGDDDSAFGGVQEMLEAMWPKLADNAHVFVFCGWKGEPEMREAVLNAGYELRGSLIWSKQSQGMGDLEGAFGPSHERILHAVKGKPVLYKRIADVLTFSRESSERHPTEKPTELLSELIRVTTVNGELVADPFGGVASTAVAARDTGRRWWSTELAEKYHEIGDERLMA